MTEAAEMAREFLSGVWRLTLQIRQDERQLQELEIMEHTFSLRGMDYSKERVQGGIARSMDDVISEYVDESRKLRESIAHNRLERVKRRDELTGLILDNTSKQTYAEVLIGRYVAARSIYEISLDMDKSYDRVRHLHQESLEDFWANYQKAKN